MARLFSLEIKRLHRSKVLWMSIGLVCLIGGLGAILNQVFYSELNKSETLLFSLYNSYTQFAYLVLGVVFVNVFAKDFQNGVYAWIEQLGYPLYQVLLIKLASIVLLVLPLINLLFILVQVLYGKSDLSWFFECIYQVNVSVIYIILLALLLALVFKKVLSATLVMYGLFMVFNGGNFICYGLFNPADANSIGTYFVSKKVFENQTHYSISKVMWSDEFMRILANAMPVIWIAIWCLVIALLMKRNTRGTKYD